MNNDTLEKVWDFSELFHRISAYDPQMTAFVSHGDRITFGQFICDTRRIMGRFPDPDRYVVIETTDKYFFAVAFFALVLTGNVAVLKSTDLVFPEGDHHISCDCRIDDEWMRQNIFGKQVMGSPHHVQQDRVCAIVFTSGTSDDPRGVMLSHKNICSAMCAGREILLYAREEKYVSILPLNHVFGLVADLLVPMYSGSTVCFSDSPFSFFNDIRRFKADAVNVPPIVASTLLEKIEQDGNAETVTGGKLKKILCGGAGLDPEISVRYEKYGILAVGCYGLTETASCVSVNGINEYEFGSAGKIVSCSKVKIAADGEILVAGDNVMAGYWEDPDATREKIPDGWLHTGDLGYVQNGFLYITGRKTSMIVFDDGTKVIPEMYEKQLRTLSHVVDAVVFCDKTKNKNALSARVEITGSEYAHSVVQEIRNNNDNMPHPIVDIEVQLEPLERGRTGKIVRKNG